MLVHSKLAIAQPTDVVATRALLAAADYLSSIWCDMIVRLPLSCSIFEVNTDHSKLARINRSKWHSRAEPSTDRTHITHGSIGSYSS